MLVYILRRLLLSLSVVLAVTTITFAVFFLGPSDPVAGVCGTKCTPDRVDAIRQAMQLDMPAYQQYLQYIKGIFTGREFAGKECAAPCLGWSFNNNRSVTSMLADAFPVTLSLVVGGVVVYVTLGLLFGVITARFRGTWIDRTIVGLSQFLASIPYYVLAILFFLYGMLFLKVVPRAGWTPPWEDPVKWFVGLLGVWLFYGAVASTSYIRYVRSSMIDVQSQDYIRTARSKGLSEQTIAVKHALRAAIAPFVTLVGLSIAGELGGAIFTEKIFQLPGMGKMALDAFGNDDLPVIAGSVLIGCIIVTIGNLVVDLLYGVIDPRVRLQ